MLLPPGKKVLSWQTPVLRSAAVEWVIQLKATDGHLFSTHQHFVLSLVSCFFFFSYFLVHRPSPLFLPVSLIFYFFLSLVVATCPTVSCLCAQHVQKLFATPKSAVGSWEFCTVGTSRKENQRGSYQDVCVRVGIVSNIWPENCCPASFCSSTASRCSVCRGQCKDWPRRTRDVSGAGQVSE